jgi:Domain of unknown function (DUF4349)
MIMTGRLLLASAILAGLAACNAEREAPSEATMDRGMAVSEPAMAVVPPEAAGADRSEQPPAHALPDSVRPTMLIRNGAARVEVDSLDEAVAAVRALAARAGGYVTNVAIQTGEERIREATLTLRLPALRFDDALTGLQPIGRVESVNVMTEDVGEEYVDVQMRLANARRLEERLLELLGSRTGQLNDVLAVERELARVREQIERQEGRLRYLRTRADMSTLTVTVHEPGPLVARYPGQNVLSRALQQSLRNFVGLIAVVIASLGVVVPLAAAAWVGWILVRRARRGRTAPRVPHGADTSTVA